VNNLFSLNVIKCSYFMYKNKIFILVLKDFWKKLVLFYHTDNMQIKTMIRIITVIITVNYIRALYI